AQHADEIYLAFSPEQQAIARRLMLRLTQPGEGTEDTRRRATLDELVTHPAEAGSVEAAVDVPVGARPLTIGGEEAREGRWVDVAHEALIRGWPRLRSWLEEDRSGLRLHRRLTEAAKEWQRLHRDADLLYRGSRLSDAQAFAERQGETLNALERDFLGE